MIFLPRHPTFARLPTVPVQAIILSAVLLSILSGCQHYRTGALPNAEEIRIYLEPTQNEAYISGYASMFQRELSEAIHRSPLLVQTSDERSADYSVRVRLRNFEKHAIAYAESDTGQPASARYSLEAWVTITDSSDGRALIENQGVRSDISVYVDSADSFTLPGFQSKPTFARNLATDVTREIENRTAP